MTVLPSPSSWSSSTSRPASPPTTGGHGAAHRRTRRVVHAGTLDPMATRSAGARLERATSFSSTPRSPTVVRGYDPLGRDTVPPTTPRRGLPRRSRVRRHRGRGRRGAAALSRDHQPRVPRRVSAVKIVLPPVLLPGRSGDQSSCRPHGHGSRLARRAGPATPDRRDLDVDVDLRPGTYCGRWPRPHSSALWAPSGPTSPRFAGPGSAPFQLWPPSLTLGGACATVRTLSRCRWTRPVAASFPLLWRGLGLGLPLCRTGAGWRRGITCTVRRVRPGRARGRAFWRDPGRGRPGRWWPPAG